MDELVEELRERNQPVPTPLELPDADLLVEVEEQLLISLPREYREFLLTVSDVVYGSLEPATAADPQSHTFLPEMAAAAWDRGLPRDMIPLCETARGYYCVAQDDSVLLWQDGDFSEDEWETVWYWARDVWLKS